MRIGILTYDYDPPIGGLGVVAKASRKVLEKLSSQDTFIAISPSSGADDRVSLLAAIFWRKFGGCPLFSLILFLQLPSLIRKHRLDLLHLHAGSGGVFLLRKPSCPLVMMSHHTYLQEAEIVFLHAPLKGVWKKIMARLEKRTYSFADKIVCVSKDTADFIIDRYQQPRSKVTVIENFVEDCRRQRLIPKSASTILFVGRLEERKGVTVLLEAMKFVAAKKPDVRLRLLGENLMGDRIFKFIESKKLQDVISVSGYVHDPLLFREMLNATVLVVPSLLEGFGLVAAQGMLAGTCVLASDAPGLRSVIRDHQTGLLFRSGDAADCARAILEILNDPVLRSRLEQQGREDALKRFSPEERMKDLHRVFEIALTLCK